jgi:hypothetical protein
MILIIFTFFSCSFKPKYLEQMNNQFSLNVKKESVSVIYEKETWGPNGDGFYVAKLSFKNRIDVQEILNQRNFNSLPIKEDLPISEIHQELNYLTKGFYLVRIDKNDPRDFEIVVIDSNNNELTFYYQLY